MVDVPVRVMVRPGFSEVLDDHLRSLL